MAVPTKDELTKCFDPEELITCPYNTAHTIMRERMRNHLIRCRKQHEEVAKEFKDCPFNINHKIPRLEYHYHLETCSERENFFSMQYSVGEVENDIVPMLQMNIKKQIEVPCDENWDEVTGDSQIVNIIEGMEALANEKAVLKNHQHLTKSEKKKLIEDNRRAYCEKLNEEGKSMVSKATDCSSSFTSYPPSRRSAISSYSDNDDDDDEVKSTVTCRTTNSHASTRTDISYQTAEKKAEDKFKKFQKVERPKIGLGRCSIIPVQMNLQRGIGRGRIRKDT